MFWAVLVPWWSFPAHAFTRTTRRCDGHLAALHLPVWVLALWMVVLGTIAPFFLLVSALRHLPATRVGIVAMLEPVVGALVGWVWLGESLGGIQLDRRRRRAGRNRLGADSPLDMRITQIFAAMIPQRGRLGICEPGIFRQCSGRSPRSWPHSRSLYPPQLRPV